MNKPTPSPGPNRETALAQYRQRASTYDLELALFEPLRRAAIERLALTPGDVVLDVGCGTGLSLGALTQGVGRHGRVVGVEQCPQMIERARERVARGAWPNVRLLCAPAETAQLPARADAALFHFTHDILRRPEAVAHVMRHLKPGARVVACGLKWTADWGGLANLFVWPAALRSVSSLEGLHEPWSRLAASLQALDVQTVWGGAVYIACGHTTGPARGRGPA